MAPVSTTVPSDIHDLGLAPQGVMRVEWADVNGWPGLVAYGPQGPITAVNAEAGPTGLVTQVHMVSNPDKLRAIAEGRRLPL